MKHISLTIILPLLLICCGDRLTCRYSMELPEPPPHWVSLLGEPHWRLEWVDEGGNKRIKDVLPGKSVKVDLPATWTNPITALPYWPEHNLIPGHFKPAGALFPFDISGEQLRPSWEAGPNAVFYWELAIASEGGVKIPANFDWRRFRELFESDELNEAVREDPWLIDWHSVAERTMSSNFDRRRLVPETVESVKIPVSKGPWYAASPFAQPLYFSESETPVFPIRAGFNVWISREGILRYSGKVWIFTSLE